jgi:hypothetical protein
MTRTDEWDECFCCADPFLATQLDPDGLCTVCAMSAASFEKDGIPGGRPCCRKRLTLIRKERTGR